MTDRIKTFLRTTGLEKNEWLQLIEDRRQRIKPHLASFTLGTIGEIDCLRGGPGAASTYRIDWSDPARIGDEDYTLKTRGIFFPQPRNRMVRIPDTGFTDTNGLCLQNGTLFVWGLARDGHFILAEVAVVGEQSTHAPAYGRERATVVNIQQAVPATILERSGERPWGMWTKLGGEIQRWARDRESLWRSAQLLADTVAREHEVSEAVRSALGEEVISDMR